MNAEALTCFASFLDNAGLAGAFLTSFGFVAGFFAKIAVKAVYCRSHIREKAISLNAVYDDIISHMRFETDTKAYQESSYQQKREQIIKDMQSKLKDVLSENDGSDTSKKQLGLHVMEKDKLFSIKTTRLR